MRICPYVATLLVVVAGGLAVAATPLVAQTQFVWPDTTVDLGRYTTVAECLAATDRITDGIEHAAWAPVWRDTMPDDPQRYLAPLPASVVAAAQQCAARFDAHTASLDDFELLARLYLQAGRDADVRVLLARRLQEIGEKNHAARAMVLETMFHLYLDARPVRLASADSILHHPEWAALDRLVAYATLAGWAFTTGDTARAFRMRRELLARTDSLTPEERHSTAFRQSGVQATIYALLLLSTRDQLLDSLRQSTAAYLRVMGGLWASVTGSPATGRPPEVLPIIGQIGQHAPPITGDVWVPADAARRPHPTPGHVALIAFDPTLPCVGGNDAAITGELFPKQAAGGCFADAAVLHRLAQRYPELEITIAARTGKNVFGYLPPLSPIETAQWLEREAAAWKLPGALAIVEQSPTVRVPAPDDRIAVVSPDSNLVHYGYGADGYGPDGAFLVDEDGIIVWHIRASVGYGGTMDPLRSIWVPMIGVLLHRDKGAAAAGDHAASAEHL